MFNRVVLAGHLAADPELRFTPSGAGVCTIRLAVDGPTFNKETRRYDAVFVNVIVWNRGENKQAERCAEYLAKGRMALVEGKLNARSYEAKDGSGKRYVTEVVADNVRFIGGRGEGQASGGGENAYRPAAAPVEDGMLDFSDFGQEVQFEKDNLPF